MPTIPRVLPTAVLGLATLLAAACSEPIHAPEFPDAPAPPPVAEGPFHGLSAWSAAVDLESSASGAHPNFNTGDIEGCPFTSRDGKHLFIASDRAGGMGGIDVWYATRSGPDEPWGEPVNAGPEVNSSANDFCPTLARDGHTFYFVSTRVQDDACGGGDIYVTRWRNGAFDPPRNLGCTVNSEYDEFSPFPMPLPGAGPVLYFSSNRPRDGAVGGDIYRSESRGGVFGPPTLIPGISSPEDDGHPNVRRDGLEIYFYSRRTDLPGAQGGPDIYAATRNRVGDPWSTPVNLGPDINSAASETRPSLAWDGTLLYFGSSRMGSSDVYVTTREQRTAGSGRADWNEVDAATQEASNAGPSRPFSGTFSGAARFDPPQAPTRALFQGDGNALHLGATTNTGVLAPLDFVPVPECELGVGIPHTHLETLVAASGDRLILEMIDLACPIDQTFMVFRGTGDWTVVEGTGRFADATGSGTTEGRGDFIEGVFEFTLDGTIAY